LTSAPTIKKLEVALIDRFYEANVINEQEKLSAVVHKARQAIEKPGYGPGLPVDLRGTPYEVEVWSLLLDVPVGATTNYESLAAKLGSRDARDVTEAIAANPIAVLVPCHRVIKKDGSISGYRWGVKRKRELLTRDQRLQPFQLD
jgi:AraC family transcriptional regulator, regulatory protein of adaptative response / methylated-DNA-[protein]-cysteine methyltransferase